MQNVFERPYHTRVVNVIYHIRCVLSNSPTLCDTKEHFLSSINRFVCNILFASSKSRQRRKFLIFIILCPSITSGCNKTARRQPHLHIYIITFCNVICCICVVSSLCCYRWILVSPATGQGTRVTPLSFEQQIG